jgi:glycosyltransferase involved in cell wall biosynthesis
MPGISDESGIPALSVIVPARNAAATLARCLDAITGQASEGSSRVEIIVVDDCSADETAFIASSFNVRLVKLDHHFGPSAARNRGAEIARAPILFFLDADVVLTPGALARAEATTVRPGVGAVIGSYDDDPVAHTIVSRFKNLTHHYFHQRSRLEATTFWSGCGLVRREVFFDAGGFDEDRRNIEDIELGYRMIAQGTRIILDPRLQVKHLKQWTLRSLLATDVLRRAIPWTLLYLEGRGFPDDLNLSTDQRIAAIVALALALGVIVAPFMFQVWFLVGALIVLASWVNRDLYLLLYCKGGLWFAINGFLLQQLYYLYSLFSLGAGVAIFVARSITRRVEAALGRSRP